MNLIEQFPGIRQHIPLAPHTTLKIGGPADYFYVATTIDDLARIAGVAEEMDIPYLVIGAGANILFPDAGYRGLIIKNECKAMRVDGNDIIAESGVLAVQLTAYAQQHALSGIEAWIALPGTIGGAIRGNAGCFGVETKDLLVSAKIAYRGTIEEVTPEYFNFDYRESTLKHSPRVVLEGRFRLTKGDPEAMKATLLEFAHIRREKQPAGQTVGSFFKNPLPEHAGRLIEAAGLKGKQMGGVQISPVHANFLMNVGGGTATDVLALKAEVQRKVKEQFGIDLEPEVHIITNE